MRNRDEKTFKTFKPEMMQFRNTYLLLTTDDMMLNVEFLSHRNDRKINPCIDLETRSLLYSRSVPVQYI